MVFGKSALRFEPLRTLMLMGSVVFNHGVHGDREAVGLCVFEPSIETMGDDGVGLVFAMMRVDNLCEPYWF